MRTHVIRIAVLGALCAAAVVGCKKQKPKPPGPDLELEELRSNLVRAALVNLTNPKEETPEAEATLQLGWSPKAQSDRSGIATPLATEVQRPSAAQDARGSSAPRTEQTTDVQTTRPSQAEPVAAAPSAIAPSRSETAAEQGEGSEQRADSGEPEGAERRSAVPGSRPSAATAARIDRRSSGAAPGRLGAAKRVQRDEAEATEVTQDAPVSATGNAQADAASEPQRAAEEPVPAENPSEGAAPGGAAPEEEPKGAERSQPADRVAKREGSEAEQTKQTEVAVRRAISSAFSALYGAGSSGFTGDSAGLNGFTGIGAGPGYTGEGAGLGSTGIGAGPGYTGEGAGLGSTGTGAGPGHTGVGAGPGSTGVGAGPGSTGIGAGQGFTGVTAGSWGSTGIAGSRAPTTMDTTSTPTSTSNGAAQRPEPPRPRAVVWLTPWGPVLLPMGY